MSQSSADPDKEELLALLNARGHNFLSSFGPLPGASSQPSRKRRKLEVDVERDVSDEKSEVEKVVDDESAGFNSASSVNSGDEDSDVDCSDDMSDGEGVEDYDDDFRSDQVPRKQPEVVVFSGASTSGGINMSRLQAKSFMSSKVSRLRQDISDTKSAEGVRNGDEYEEERTNIQNDKLLHKLVHTQLLSGSLNSELNLTPAQRRKALEGRVLELAASAKLGKGESAVRQEERKKAAKSVRMGLERKVEERRRKALEEAKDLGNYHRSIKHLFEADSDKRPERRKRDRGLKLGVGKFAGGVLKLSKDEIASVQGSARPQRGGKGSNRKGTRKK